MKKITFILSILVLLLLLGAAILEKEIYPIPPKMITQSDLNGVHNETWRSTFNVPSMWSSISAKGNLKYNTERFIPQNASFGDKQYFWEINVFIYIFNNNTNVVNYSHALYKSEGPQLIYNEYSTKLGITSINYTSGKWDRNKSSEFNQTNLLAVDNQYLIWIHTLTFFISPQTDIGLVSKQVAYFNETNPYI